MVLAATMPARLGRFRLVTPIGRGGMASVYLGLAEVTEGVHREVAIKLMHPHFSEEGQDGVRTLIEEGKLAARIRHPNVVAVEEVAVADGCVYLVMEYVHGESLLGLVRAAARRDTTLPLPIAARIVSDALLGLMVAHELCDGDGEDLEIVHRDFTPANILVGVDGYARLADFGIARARSRASATITGQVKGKIGYMPPEQLMGQALDRRGDVWAAGVLAWECLVGRPFKPVEEDEYAFMLRVVQGDIEPLAQAAPSLPARLAAVVDRALSPLDVRTPSIRRFRSELLDAWTEVSDVAEPSEVGKYLEEQTSETLVARRRASELAKRAPPIMDPPSEVVVTSDPGETSRAATLSSPSRLSRVLGVAALVVAVGAITAATVMSLDRRDRGQPSAATNGAVPPVIPSSTSSVGVEPTVSVGAAPSSSELAPPSPPPGASTRSSGVWRPRPGPRSDGVLAPTPYKK